MALKRFKLLAGRHQGPDFSKEPDDNGKRPSKTYKEGEVVVDEADLVALLGREKFQLLGAKKGKVEEVEPDDSSEEDQERDEVLDEE